MKIKWLCAFLLAISFAGCAPKEEENKDTSVKEITEVPVIKLEQRDTSLHQYYVADIQAVKNVEIRARVQGFLEKMYVDEGRRVTKGQLLFKISNREFLTDLKKATANVASARAAAKIAELELERIKTLVDKKVISKTEVDLGKARLSDARAKVDEALTTVDDANTKLNYTAVRSPFTGVIDRIPLKIGSLVDDGTLLTTISDNHEMYAYFNVSENEYLQNKKTGNKKFSENKAAALILSDGSKYPLLGKIETHEAEFSDNTGSIAFRAKFPNPDYMLKHGASGKVQLTTKLSNTLLLPQKSVLEIQDKSFVFVVTTNNTVKMQSFVPHFRISEYYVVKSGLTADDKIVYEGVQNIRDGAQIKPRYTIADSLMAER